MSDDLSKPGDNPPWESPGGHPMGAWGLAVTSTYLVLVAVFVVHSLVVLWPAKSPSGRNAPSDSATPAETAAGGTANSPATSTPASSPAPASSPTPDSSPASTPASTRTTAVSPSPTPG